MPLHRKYTAQLNNKTHRADFFLEKLTISQLVKNFLALYGYQRFITAFTTAHHLSIS